MDILRLVILVGCAFGFSLGAFGQTTKFIPFKNYLIPVASASALSNCPAVEPALQSLPKVIYFDDVGVQNADPNGLQELPIIMGLHREEINLLAIATRLTDSASRNLFKAIVSTSTQDDVDIIAPSEIAQRIVDEAKCIPTGKFLYVALGAEWYELEDVLDIDDSNSDKIFAVGWQIANGGGGVSGPKKTSYDNVRAALPGRAIAIDTLNSQGNPVFDSSGYPETQYFSSTHQSLKVFHVFRQTASYSAGDFDNFYNSHLDPILDDFVDNQNRNIASESEWYIEEARALNSQTSSPGPGTGTNTKLRVGDFLTIAYVLDKSTMFNTQIMLNLIEDAVDNF